MSTTPDAIRFVSAEFRQGVHDLLSGPSFHTDAGVRMSIDLGFRVIEQERDEGSIHLDGAEVDFLRGCAIWHADAGTLTAAAERVRESIR